MGRPSVKDLPLALEIELLDTVMECHAKLLVQVLIKPAADHCFLGQQWGIKHQQIFLCGSIALLCSIEQILKFRRSSPLNRFFQFLARPVIHSCHTAAADAELGRQLLKSLFLQYP